jgi:glycosyltransferase involved in cell wall biosynthesis
MRNSPKQITIVCVGPAVSVPGGMSRVIEAINTHFPPHLKLRLAETFTQYLARDGVSRAERGTVVGQILVYAGALVRILARSSSRTTVFHVHFSNRGSAIRKGLICVLLRALRCRYVTHAHTASEKLFHDSLPEPLCRMLGWGLGGGSSVFALTHHWCEHYRALFGVPESRVMLLPNPAILPKVVPDRSQQSTVKLLFLGRVGFRKGTFDLIRAFAAVPADLRANCSLTIAGDGEVEVARNLADELQCTSQVRILDWIPKDEVNRHLADADVLLLPSHAEGMAMALIEGMSWGLAVIATAAGGATEFLIDGRNCLLVPPGDIAAIRDAICAVVSNPSLRRSLGTEARSTAAAFDIDKYIVRLASIYVSILDLEPQRDTTPQSAKISR